MSYGLQLKNSHGDIVVDSDFSHYHFAGKATMFHAASVPNAVGGEINGPHVTTAGQHISSGQISGDVFKYRLPIGVAHEATDSAPMCFLKPASVGASAPRCGIVLMQPVEYNLTPHWEIWVLQDKGHTRPEMYCFLPLSDMTPSQKDPGVGNDVGLATFDDAGVQTYDSRLQPLKIVGTTAVRSPDIARAGAINNSTWNPDFRVDQTQNYTFSTSSGETGAGDLMFYCPSFAHACQHYIKETGGEGFQPQGYGSYFYIWARVDLWWCFYRATYRLTGATSFQSSFTTYASGHVWDSEEDTAGILTALFAALLAPFTFGASFAVVVGLLAGGLALTAALLNAGFEDGIYFPYENDSRNAGEYNPVLFTKASYYD